MSATEIKNDIKRTIKKLYLKGRGIYYSGNNYRCPVCNKSFRKLLPGGFNLDVIKQKEIIGAGYRQNNICPNCQSTDRDRLVYLFLKHKTNVFTAKLKVLHVSPEPALYSLLSKLPNIDYVTGTKYAEGIYYHKEIRSIDLLDLPFGDNEFDLIICNHILEHIIDDNKAMTELLRVLAPTGVAIMQVPYSNLLNKTYENEDVITRKEREEHFGQFDHVRIYGKDYANRLSNAGFTVEVFDPIKEKIADENDNKIAINLNEKLFTGRK